MTKQWQAKALNLAVATDLSWREIAAQVGTPRSTVSDYLRKVTATKSSLGIPEQAKILLFDLETAPSKAYVWQRWKQNISQAMTISEGYILTYAAKWLGSDTIMSGRITERENDTDLVRELAQIINQADIIVAHNAIKFDIPLFKTRMLAAGMKPLNPVKVVDTLLIAKKQFRFPSNALDSLAAYLGLDRKVQHGGFDLWKRCMDADDAAFEEMQEYNDQDVEVLEQVYLKLRAWSPTHPNVALYEEPGESRCVCCGSLDLKSLGKKKYYTSVQSYEALECQVCGKVSRRRKTNSIHGKELLTSTGN